MGWAARFLAEGYDMDATDPVLGAQDRLRAQAGAALGSITQSANGEFRFTANMASAISAAGFIQESASDREDFKRDLIGRIDAAAPAHAVIASSTSALSPSSLQNFLKRCERFMVDHPFNRVYLIPLVEVIYGKATSAAAMLFSSIFGTS